MNLRILGLDPGIGKTGWGLLERNGAALKVESGVITTRLGRPEAERLAELYRKLRRLLRKTKPQAAAMEQIFFVGRVTNAARVGQARGVLLAALAKARVPVRELNPSTVKRAACGYGRAGKPAMRRAIARRLQLPRAPADDAADALAVALAALKLSEWEARVA